jgi:large subunit ribosomal protein L13
LRGKYKPNFTPHVDCGDNVIIINADKVKLTGNKWNDRVYLRFSGYPGGQEKYTPAQLMKKPKRRRKIAEKSSKEVCFLRTNWVQTIGNLYVYAGSEHKHEAQTRNQLI